MPTLRFRFDLDKLVNALAYFAKAGVSDLTKLKAAKLLYLADRRHLLEHGRPITGDHYVAMDYGPVPESAYRLMNQLIRPDEVQSPALDRAAQTVAMHKSIFARYPTLKNVASPDLDVFSDSEVEALKATVHQYGRQAASKLVDLTHTHEAYKKADALRSPGSSVDLPYDYFLDDASPDERAQALLLAADDQENDAIAAAFETAGRLAIAADRSLVTR